MTQNQTQLRVGIVGCGYQGGIFAQTIARSDAWQVTACADPDQTAAARVASIAGNAATFASVKEMLARAEIDAVIVATPHHVLRECSLAAIRAGKHMLAEKPIGVNEQQAAQIEEAVTRTDVCFMAGYSFRYIAALQKVRELLQQGAVGEIHTIVGSIGISPLLKDWKARLETGGGALLYIGSHLVDEMLWYLGDEPVAVDAHIRYRADTRADETTTFQIRFARGAVAQGAVTQAATGFFNNLDIFGDRGRIGLRGTALDYDIQVLSSALPIYSQPTNIHSRQMDDLRILMHLPQLTEFAEAIHQRRQPSCTATDARRVLKVLDALQESGRAGQPVRIG